MRKSYLLVIGLLFGISLQLYSQTTIFQPSDVPANPAANDASGSITNGVKFRSSQAGYITAIRYYKGSGTSGTRSGHLFTSGGTLLASVTFTGETSSGWQQMAFSTPVAISASTTYIATCYSSSGDYAYDAGYFASSGVTNGTLTALQNGTDGSNGLYDYNISSSTAPASSYGGANYWVDVVFDNTAPTVSSVTPANSATGIGTGTTVTATFSEAVNSSTVTTSTFQLKDPGNNIITATVGTSSNVITLTPSSPLSYSTTYTATIISGGSGVKDLAGNALASNYTWSFTTGSSSPWSLGGNTGTNPPTDFLGTTDSTALVFKVDSQEKMRLSPTGILLIGTTDSPNPSDTSLKLAVKGSVYTKKLKVTQSSWADYVFQPQYKLLTLKEVEAFIQKNKHLPDVPSENEVKKSGLDVGDNQAVLLKKIEELTLYLIELNKKVDKLSEENDQLKKKLKKR